MTIGSLAWIIGAGIVVLVINVAISFLWVAIYAYLINRGHDKQYYETYAETAAPYSGIIAGAPLMFLMCWWVSGWGADFAVKAAILVWLVYAVVDVIMLVASGIKQAPTRMIVLVAISIITKLAAAYLGGLVGSRQV